jgi:nucleotide-binding universal stress UspA family protein
MLKMLVAVDGSDNANRVVEFLASKRQWYRDALEVHLLSVQVPLAGVNVKLFVSSESLNDYYREQGEAALARAKEILAGAGVAFVPHIGVGDPAEVIVQYADAKGCEQIVMGSRGLGAVGGLVLGSVATKVLHLAKIPILLVK